MKWPNLESSRSPRGEAPTWAGCRSRRLTRLLDEALLRCAKSKVPLKPPQKTGRVYQIAIRLSQCFFPDLQMSQ